MPSIPSTLKARVAGLLAVLAVGATGGLVAGCGGSDPVSDDTVPSSIKVTTPAGEVTQPASTDATTSTDATSASPSSSTVPATVPTTATQTTSSTVPGGSASTNPADTGGHAAPDGDTATTTTKTTTNSGGVAADQDPDCRAGTGPGQADPQCEPVAGPDAQDPDN